MQKNIIKILFICFLSISNLWAYRCHSDRCTDLRFGLGSYYGNFTTHYGDINDIGGLFSGLMEGHWRYFNVGFDLNMAYAYQHNKHFGSQTFTYTISPYIGANTGSLHKPFFIDFVMPLEYYEFGLSTNYRERNASIFFGGRIYQRIPITEEHEIEYSLSYSVAPFVRRAFYNHNELYDELVKGNNIHRIEFNLGYLYRNDLENVYQEEDRLKRPDFYTRLKAIYYRQNQVELTPTLQYPSANNFALMLEVGVSLDTSW